MSVKVYVGGLPFSKRDSDLQELFSKYGPIHNAHVVMEKDNAANSRGFGFVEFEREEDAKIAIEALNETDFGGRNIMVQMAGAPTGGKGMSQNRQQGMGRGGLGHGHGPGGGRGRGPSDFGGRRGHGGFGSDGRDEESYGYGGEHRIGRGDNRVSNYDRNFSNDRDNLDRDRYGGNNHRNIHDDFEKESFGHRPFGGSRHSNYGNGNPSQGTGRGFGDRTYGGGYGPGEGSRGRSRGNSFGPRGENLRKGSVYKNSFEVQGGPFARQQDCGPSGFRPQQGNQRSDWY